MQLFLLLNTLYLLKNIEPPCENQLKSFKVIANDQIICGNCRNNKGKKVAYVHI